MMEKCKHPCRNTLSTKKINGMVISFQKGRAAVLDKTKQNEVLNHINLSASPWISVKI
jgi:hypothetical protein